MKNKNSRRAMRAAHSKRGGALISVILFTAVVTILAGVALTIAASSASEVEHERKQIQALYSAEAGVNAGLAQLTLSWRTGAAVAATVGDYATPAGEENNRFWTTLTDNPDDTFTILATGQAGNQVRSIEVIARPQPPTPFEHAMYAGNLSGDPTYDLRLSGLGGQADEVTGHLFSGGDLTIEDDASVGGEVRATGVITGGSGQEGLKTQVPQILDIDYELFNDYNVSSLFSAAPRIADNAGGTAGQLPETSPAHIFRLNPSDRTSDTDATTKDDYFFEDPYESVTSDIDQDGSDAFEVSLPAAANNKVFFIDGNLWLHNKKTLSLKIKNEGLDPTQVTFVVKGNIYFSDNLFYNDPAMDGVAFVALEDSAVPDSGNVYFGDPIFGTMKFAEAMIFAENDFIDNNLDEDGSSNVEIRGSMTAGNQVDIQRDFVRTDGSVAHTQLKLTFDPRQTSGALNLPGIPMQGDQTNGYLAATWREVPTPRVYAAPAAPTVQVENPVSPGLGGSTPEPGDGDYDPNNWRHRWGSSFSEWKSNKRSNKWRGAGGY